MAAAKLYETLSIGLYHLAEKYLDTSANLYEVAGYPAKKNAGVKQLKRIHEELELLLNPFQVLKENPAMSRTVLTPVSLTLERAVGLEQFEPAKVVGSLTIEQKRPSAGSTFDAELEMVNIGTTSATLVKIEGLAEDGIEIDPANRSERIGDDSIDLRGEKLEYLQTHRETVKLKALSEGAFELRPRLLFVDETESYRSYDFQNVSVTVTEAVPIRIPTVSPITSFLAKAFIDDYMIRRLVLEHSGWRSLMNVVEGLRIPKARLYGDSRYGHTFGKPLEDLVKAGIVEYRITPGVRGRGGNVMKIRVSYSQEPVRRLVDEMALKPLQDSKARAWAYY